jgi:flagellar biogenesis protein FliO
MEIWNQFGMIIAVLGGLIAVLLWLKKGGFVSTTGLMTRPGATRVRELKIVDKVVVSAQHTIVLLEVKETRLLVCLSPAGSSTTVLKGEQ